MDENAAAIVEALRTRVLRGLETRTLAAGDRLPSARAVAREFGVDFRVILGAYRALAGEQLVTLRPRGGIYVAAQRRGAPGTPPLPEGWIVDVLAEARARSVPPRDFHEWLRRCTETLRLRAVVIASGDDQAAGLCRELVDDFGVAAEGRSGDQLSPGDEPDLAMRRADLLVTTRPHADLARRLAERLRTPVIIIDEQPEILSSEWALLLRQPVYAVVATDAFGRALRRLLAAVPGVENLRILVLGRDDLTMIPPDAPTYVTHRVRASLGAANIPGRALPPSRTIRSASARALLAFIVRANLAARSARHE